MLTVKLSDAEILTLRYEMYHYPDALVQKRLHSIYLKSINPKLNCSEIGHYTTLHRKTVSACIRLYNTSGLDALKYNNYGTNVSDLSSQKKVIIQDLETHPVSSLKEAQARIETLTGISRSLSSISNFLKQNGFKFRKMGHIPAKADVEKQQQFIENELNTRIQQAKMGEIHLLFMDAAHFVLAPFICCIWSITRFFIKAPAGRQRLNVIGTVDAITKNVLFQWNITVVNAETLQDFLKFLVAKLPDKPLVIVLDNARYQHCKIVKELASLLNITLLFLPPYSPNLNIIERLWKLIKKKYFMPNIIKNFQTFRRLLLTVLTGKMMILSKNYNQL